MAKKGKTVEVEISRIQTVCFSGRTLGSVTRQEDFLVVNKKRVRGGKFDDHYYHMKDVIAYCEGEGGKENAAFAIVKTKVILKTLYGVVESADNADYAKLTVIESDEGNSYINMHADVTVSMVSDAKLAGEEEPNFDEEEEEATAETAEEVEDIDPELDPPKRKKTTVIPTKVNRVDKTHPVKTTVAKSKRVANDWDDTPVKTKWVDKNKISAVKKRGKVATRRRETF